ncbi:Phospholipase A2, membrane associated [Lemmus lemmus]
MRLVLLCGLLLLAGITPTQGGILNLNKMIKRMTGKTAFFSYWFYGCHCGVGGKGEPRDATDGCCFYHDCCYERMEDHDCGTKGLTYRFAWQGNDITCSSRTTCQRQTCECDKRAALCFRHNLGTYNRKYAHYPNKLCTGPTPPC